MNTDLTVCCYQNQPIYALPSDAPNWLHDAALERFLSLSWRRRVFKHLLRLLRLIKLDSAFFKPLSITPLAISEVLQHLSLVFPAEDYHNLLFNFRLPHDSERAYLSTFNQFNQPTFFCKIGFDLHSQQCIQQEATAIEKVNELHLTSVIVPKVKKVYHTEVFSILVLEPMQNLKHNFPFSPIDFLTKYNQEIWSKSKSEALLMHQNWWQHWLQLSEFPKLKTQLNDNQGSYTCAFAHGDLRQGNIVTCLQNQHTQYFLVDWEHADSYAPYLTDTICLVADHYQCCTVTELECHLNQLNIAAQRRDILLSIAYLVTLDDPLKPNILGKILAKNIND